MKKDRKNISNVPILRFPGFEGEWEVKKLGEVCDVTTGNKDTQNKVDDGLYPFFVRSNTVERINSYSFDGESILTSGDGVGVGKNFHYINGRFDFHQRVYCLRNFKSGHLGKYIYSVFSEKFYDRVIRLSAKNSVDSVRMSMITDMKIYFPSLPEQQKIASFLSLIDERILAQSKIIDRLESLIKGVSESLLKHKSTNIKLNDCLICHSSTLMEGNVYDSLGEYPVYGAVGVVAHTDSYDIDEDAILIIKDGAGVGRVQYAKGKHSVTGTLNYLTPKDGIHLKYMYYCLRIFNFDKYKVGSGIPHIYFKDYGHEYIYCPPVEKQQKIASILSAIDKKIEIEKRILEEYTAQKKFLLKQMFI